MRAKDADRNDLAILDADASRPAALLVGYIPRSMRPRRALPAGRLDADPWRHYFDHRPIAGIVAIAIVGATGCLGTPVGGVEAPELDREMFVSQVQPILAERCGNPSCHGRPDRPFSIYSPGRYRATAERTFLVEPLTEEEARSNWVGACGFAIAEGDRGDCLLLRKPLSSAAGGTGHLGGDVWSDRREPEFRMLEAWVWADEP